MPNSPTPGISEIQHQSEDHYVRSARRREKRRLRAERAEWWSTKLHALLWVVGAILAFLFSDFYHVCLSSNKVNRVMFYIGATLFVFEVLAICRIAFWMPKINKNNNSESSVAAEMENFENSHPNFILATTLGGILCFIVLTIAFWPVYRIFSPFLLLLFWFGILMSMHFFP